jgi:cell volume regulation protein A
VNVQQVLRDIGLILGAGLLAAPIATLLRLPVMLVLVAVGALIGPSALGLVESPLGGLGAQLVFTLGVSLILFHGGLEISLRVISRTAFGLGMLVLPGVLVTALIVAAVAAPVFSVPFAVALLLGAVLAATDPAILIPLFDRLRLRPKVSQTVIAESAFNDPTGTILALTVASAVVGGGVTMSDTVLDFVRSLALGAVFGLGGGILLALMLSSHAVGIWRESPAVVVLALVSLEYFTADELGGSSYLAAFVMGLVVGNSDVFGIGRNAEHTALLDSFMAQVAEIAVLAVFVTLGINLPFDALQEYFWGGLVVMLVFVFVARPVTVLVCLLPDRRGSWTWQELVFLSWCRETGVVPAAIASLLLARDVEGADIAVALVAMAIVVTLLLQATTAGVLARRLGLLEGIEPEPG